MKAAGEKAEMQPPIAALRGGLAQLPAERHVLRAPLRGFWRCVAAPAHEEGERQGQEHRAADADHRTGPADAEDRGLHQRRKDELPERPGGVDDPGGERAALARQALHHRADQDRQAAGPGAERADDAERRDELPLAVDERSGRGAGGGHQSAEHDHPARSVAVGDRAENRLRHAPDELPDRDRQADRDDAEPGRHIERRDEEADRLPRAHGEEQDRAGGGDHQVRQLRGAGRGVHRAGLIRFIRCRCAYYLLKHAMASRIRIVRHEASAATICRECLSSLKFCQSLVSGC